MKQLLKKLLLGGDPIPQYAAVPLEPQQRLVEVRLHGLGEPLEVTKNCVVAALKPLTFAVMLNDEMASTASIAGDLALRFCESGSPRASLGAVYIRFSRTIRLPGYSLCLFEVRGHSNFCVPPLRLRMQYLYWRWQSRRSKDPYNFSLSPKDLHALLVFYTCPRPVHLVTVQSGESSNIFPMDLVGTTDSPYFLLALRSTSPSIRLMKESRRVVLSSIPFDFKDIAYELGKHHRKPSIDFLSLPFETAPSPLFELPMPSASLHVRELQVEESLQVGSHTLFVATVTHDQSLRNGLQFFHVQGFYQHLRNEKQTAWNAS